LFDFLFICLKYSTFPLQKEKKKKRQKQKEKITASVFPLLGNVLIAGF